MPCPAYILMEIAREPSVIAKATIAQGYIRCHCKVAKSVVSIPAFPHAPCSQFSSIADQPVTMGVNPAKFAVAVYHGMHVVMRPDFFDASLARARVCCCVAVDHRNAAAVRLVSDTE